MIVAIDPGFRGAIALLDPISRHLEIHDMPVLKGTTGKSITDLRELGRILDSGRRSARNVSMMEKVGPMPLDGKDRIWTFGRHVGSLEMALVGLGYESHTVTAGIWKKHFKLVADKAASRALAMDRFPSFADLFKRVKDDGRAEAALIALYALETISGLQPRTAA